MNQVICLGLASTSTTSIPLNALMKAYIPGAKHGIKGECG